MFRLNCVLLCILTVTCALRVITIDMFNNQKEGEDVQIKRMADAILEKKPDVITVQESHGWTNGTPIVKLKTYLGKEWSGVLSCHGGLGIYTNEGVEIVGMHEHTSQTMSARIRMRNGFEANVWSVFLQWNFYVHDNFGTIDSSAETRDKIIENEKTRVSNIVELLKNEAFRNQIKYSNGIPVIVAGDFNTPSDLDWIYDTKHNHHNATIDWPATKLFRNAAGMTDSFREVHPDPSIEPGTTYASSWASGPNGERVDHIYYRGPIRPTSSYVVNITSKTAAVTEELHAVFTQFKYAPYQLEKEPSFFINSQYNEFIFSSQSNCVAEPIA